jgi:hypothetical protein
VVNTVPTIDTPVDDARRVRAVGVFVRSDAEQLSRLVALIDAGELRVDVASVPRFLIWQTSTRGPRPTRSPARSSS